MERREERNKDVGGGVDEGRKKRGGEGRERRKRGSRRNEREVKKKEEMKAAD